MIRAFATLALAATLLGACAPNQGPRSPGERFFRAIGEKANPSEIVAAELAFARAAQEDGQWTAFRKFATDDAVMFVPEPVNARDWLARQKDPAEAVRWQPHQVWSSCDGSLAVSRGAWQRPDGTQGYFTTVWERQRNGEYKWVLDQGDVLAQPLAEPEFIGTKVADCMRPDGFSGQEAGDPLQVGGGQSDDLTLSYSYRVERDLARSISVTMVQDGRASTVLYVTVAAPAAN